MKRNMRLYFIFIVLMVLAFDLSGCSKLLGPSDEDVIKAINEGGFFKGGHDDLTLQKPIVVIEKGSRNKDGSWPVKVKVSFTYYTNKETISPQVEKTLVFNLYKIKDAAGPTTWKAKIGS